jgi:hypothetical protein
MRGRGSVTGKAKKEFIRRVNQRVTYKSIDVVVSSGVLRKKFIERCRELDIKPTTVGELAGIPANILKTFYLEHKFPRTTKFVTQRKVMRMFELVGMKIRVLCSIQDIDEVREEMTKRKLVLFNNGYNFADQNKKLDSKPKWY